MFRGSLLDEAAANPTGGVRQDAANVGQLQIGADLDLAKIIDIPGASLHTTVYHDYGQSLALRALGTGFRVQEIYKNPYDHWHFGLLTYEQRLFDDRIDVAVGRTAASAYFGHLEMACNFLSGITCGIPTLLNTQAGFSLLPSATWGGRVLAKLTPRFYAMAGAFEVNAFLQHTWGLDFSTRYATGYTLPFELGYGAGFREVRLPYDVKLGAYYSNGGHADPFFNTAGRPLGTSGGTARTDEERSGIYLLADKTVWRAQGPVPRNVSLFASWVEPINETEVYRTELTGGLVWTGPFASRPRDALSFDASYLRLTPGEMEYLTAVRHRAGGTGTNDPNEFSFELDYGVQVFRGGRVMPSVQYIVNPDNASIPRTRILPDNALVLGAKLSIDLGDVLGLPHSSPGG